MEAGTMLLLQESSGLEMEKLYADLYDITNRNMQKAGKNLLMKRDTFLFKQKNQEDTFDVSLCGNCDNESFLQMAYLGMLGRMPDPGAVQKWMEKAGLEKNVFRSKLLERLEASYEFARRDIKIVNNIYNGALSSNSRDAGKYSYRTRKIRQKGYRLIKKVYMMLPEKRRKAIKGFLKL